MNKRLSMSELHKMSR